MRNGFVPLWILVLALLALLFAPIPFRYETVNCVQILVYPDEYTPCPKQLIIGWSPSIAQSLYKRMQLDISSIESEVPSKTIETNTSPQPISTWQTYDTSYNAYTFKYPPDWIVRETKDRNGNPQTYLTSSNSKKTAFSARKLPEIYITTTNPYSTSDDVVCANQTCTETEIIQVLVSGKRHDVSVIQGSVNSQFDFYAFAINTESRLHLPGYSEPVDLKIFVSYGTTEEAQIIKQIISTLGGIFRAF